MALAKEGSGCGEFRRIPRSLLRGASFWYFPAIPLAGSFLTFCAWELGAGCHGVRRAVQWWKRVPGAWLPTHQPVSTARIRCRCT